MKKSLTFAIFLMVAFSANAESNDARLDYRRNSLAEVMIYHPEDEFGVDIYKAWDSIPFPDKFDNHDLRDARVINGQEFRGVLKGNKPGLNKAKYGHIVLPASEVKENAKALEDMLNKAQIGKRMVAKWFNLHGDSLENYVFDTKLIQIRGQYNASDVDVEKALLTSRGLVSLSDAGEELIGQTFLLVNDMTYITAEQRAAAAKAAMAIIGGLFDVVSGGNAGKNLAKTTGAIADKFTGFKVITNSYLFRLEWNDSIAAVFYHDYYTATPNPQKMQAFFNDTQTFRLHYVAHEHEYSEKTELKGKYERSELVRTECTRSIDKNIAALQLQYEDFKVKTPVYAVEQNAKGKSVYLAKVGMKEGVTEKTKFQVVERVLDPESGRTTYKYVATVKPVKGQIWDNRYNAVTEGDTGAELHATQLVKKSGGEILPGMLLIEGKYRKIVK